MARLINQITSDKSLNNIKPNNKIVIDKLGESNTNFGISRNSKIKLSENAVARQLSLGIGKIVIDPGRGSKD